ncbi:hypothetical protein IPM62_03320 [Candidatus Woesebacteria bacterium]|nr:MAG: hypothetical protein IPM62_03320 [Candidatus Woesebacteria bacterium]
MHIIEEISSLLKLVNTIHPQRVGELVTNGSIKLLVENNQLAEITTNHVFLCGHDITNKLFAKSDKLDKKIKLEELAIFFSRTSDSFLRLNHIGISYAVADINSEVSLIKSFLLNTYFNLYEEPSGDPNTKWLFVGDTANWESSLFEIVLTEDINNSENLWRPHFQIDIDTKLKQGELENHLIDCFGKDFIQWKLNIPGYGIVLEMGMLGSVQGTKIYLGVGTNTRNTQFHREKILQKLQ